MDESVYELDVIVGSMITASPDEDREMYEEDREFVQDVQDILRDQGVEVDLLSMPGTVVWEGGIRSFYDLHQLQRLAAHLERGEDAQVVLSGAAVDGESIDELLADIWDEEAETKFPHLIKHQGDGGFYLPAEFEEPIWVEYGEEDDDEDEMADDGITFSFGSSHALLRELTELEGLLQRNNVAAEGPRQALQVLRTAAEQSVNTGWPIAVTM